VYDDNVNIQQVMSTKIFAVTPESSIQYAAKIMIDKKIHHLVVMDKGNLVGIVSSLDFVKLVEKSSI
jgi:CBS domain-containing protein